jgi:hypothetical protein
MKKLLSILLLFVCQLAQSQTVPQGINYQAVALDQRGQPIPGIDIVGRPIDDAEIGVRISILENTPTGNILYQEEHEVLTDLYGMFNLVIGQGLQVSVDPFSSINWQGDKFLQVELSIENDGEFALSAVQQLMSVPYAFLAENAMVAQTAVDVDDADADPSNELQTLTVSGDSLTLSNGNTVQLPAIDDADADPNNEIQVLSISNDTLYLSNGGYAVLPADQINDADADPSNEIQTLSKTGSIISLTNGGNVTVFDGNYNNLSNTPTIPTKTSDLTNDSGFLTTEVDGSTTNELQVLSLSNDTIYLTSGGYVVLPNGFDGDYSSLTNTPAIPSKTSDLTNDSGFLTAEIDGSISNELQAMSISNDTIYLSSGGFVKLPAGFDGAYSSLTGVPSLPTKTSDLTNDSGFITGEVDGSITNELQLLSMSNDTLYLTEGGFVLLPSGFDGDYNNLTNTPTIPSKTSDLTNDSGFINTEKDSSTTNELQTLSISNDTLFLSNGGFVKLPITHNPSGGANSTQTSLSIKDTLLHVTANTYYVVPNNKYLKLNSVLYSCNSGVHDDIFKINNTQFVLRSTIKRSNNNEAAVWTSECEFPMFFPAGTILSGDNGMNHTLTLACEIIEDSTNTIGIPFLHTLNTIDSIFTIPSGYRLSIYGVGFSCSAGVHDDQVKINDENILLRSTLVANNNNQSWGWSNQIKYPFILPSDTKVKHINNDPIHISGLLTPNSFVQQGSQFNNFLTSDNDQDSTNELQTLSISNDTLFLSNGGFVVLNNISGSSNGMLFNSTIALDEIVCGGWGSVNCSNTNYPGSVSFTIPQGEIWIIENIFWDNSSSYGCLNPRIIVNGVLIGRAASFSSEITLGIGDILTISGHDSRLNSNCPGNTELLGRVLINGKKYLSSNTSTNQQNQHIINSLIYTTDGF